MTTDLTETILIMGVTEGPYGVWEIPEEDRPDPESIPWDADLCYLEVDICTEDGYGDMLLWFHFPEAWEIVKHFSSGSGLPLALEISR